MSKVFPFFFQFEVRPTGKHELFATFAGAIATVIVFAENVELGQARAGRHVARNNWEIIEVKRCMVVQQHHVDNMNGVLKSVYKEAELTGIAASFDGWKKPGTRLD